MCVPVNVGKIKSKTICYLGMGVTSDQMLDLLGKLDKEDWSPKAS